MAEQQREFLGTGWAFPVMPNPNGNLRYVSDEEAVGQSIEIILGTSQGERQMRPEFGCGIYELVGEANTATLRGMVREKVREALVRWEPRVDVLNVRVESPEEQRNRLNIWIDYRIRSNNALFNLVYPFFLREGAEP
ncbi:GPW/gp25 family protein [Nitrospira sp. Nam80]